MTFKGRLLLAPLMLKLFSAENLEVPSKSGPKMAFLGKGGCISVKFWSLIPKRHTIARKRVFLRILVDVRGGVLAVGDG